MNKVTYKDKEVFVKDNTPIYIALRALGENVETPCNCLGICKKCLVKIKGDLSPLSSLEENLPRDIRLSCISKIIGNCEVLEKEDASLFIKDEETEITYCDSSRGRVLGIDIGTTGVSAKLIDLDNRLILGSYSNLNYQSEFGSDVLSRIDFSIANTTKDLHKASIKQISDIIDTLGTPDLIAISGNTTMLHIIANEPVSSLAISPYKPIFLKERVIDILGIPTTLLKGASAYIGADILAGVSYLNLINKADTLFIDIGTNGEIIFSSNNRLIATSTAAGPAFEGTNISCGMRATKGAISSFHISKDNIFNYQTIESSQAKGICGSGLVDIMSELLKNNVILKSGRFNSKMDPSFKKFLKGKEFFITNSIYISQKDIRQFQLAKAAIAAGVVSLLQEVDLSINDIKEVIIAGSFGLHLDSRSIKNIGLIPGYNKNITFVGNTSLKGCLNYLSNSYERKKMKAICLEVLELSRTSNFQDIFIKEIGF